MAVERRQVPGEAWETVEVSSGGSLPAGGSIGQVLTKLSGTDGDADWRTLAAFAGSLKNVKVTVPSAWVLAHSGGDADYEILPAVAGKTYLPIVGAARLLFNTTPYSGALADTDLKLFYGSSASGDPIADWIPAAFWGATEDVALDLAPNSLMQTTTLANNVTGQGIVLNIFGGGLADGDSDLEITLYYVEAEAVAAWPKDSGTIAVYEFVCVVAAEDPADSVYTTTLDIPAGAVIIGAYGQCLDANFPTPDIFNPFTVGDSGGATTLFNDNMADPFDEEGFVGNTGNYLTAFDEGAWQQFPQYPNGDTITFSLTKAAGDSSGTLRVRLLTMFPPVTIATAVIT